MADGKGLASLLDFARRHPAEACDLEALLDPEHRPSGLAGLWWDIRYGGGGPMPKLGVRLARLEQQGQARALPTWADVHAAAERIRRQARAQVDALLTGDAPPPDDAAQAQADATVLEQWCRAQGIGLDWAAARDRLERRLDQLQRRIAHPQEG